jgi:hypothetical protein
MPIGASEDAQVRVIDAHDLASARLQGDDPAVPLLVRDDGPIGGWLRAYPERN